MKAIGREASPTASVKAAKWLRLLSLSFITYILAFPFLLILGRTLEPQNPLHWDGFIPRIYERVIARIFMTAEYGYIVATSALFLFATIFLFWFKDQKTFRNFMIFMILGILSILIIYPSAVIAPTK
jgi:hypothetical protein